MQRIRPPRRAGSSIVLAAFLVTALAPVASATFPGSNGRLAYRALRTTDDEYRIYVRKDAGSETALTDETMPAGDPSWRHDGRRIVFSMSASFDDKSDIWVMRPNGNDQTQVTRTPGVYEFAPTYSPDGRWIAFVRGENRIFVIRPNGTGERRVVTLRGEVDSLSWSPNGRWLATAGYRNGQTDLVLVNVATGKKRWVTATAAFEGRPDWSPNGTRLVFDRLIDGENHDLFTIRWDGKRQRRLTTTAIYDEVHPAWSPDGTTIAHIRRTIAGNLRDVAIMPATPGAPADDVYMVDGDDFDPAWQPRP